VLAGTLSTRWLTSWLAYWRELGASKASLYADGLDDPLGGAETALPYDWLDVSDWLGRYEGWAHAQLWVRSGPRGGRMWLCKPCLARSLPAQHAAYAPRTGGARLRISQRSGRTALGRFYRLG